MPNSVIACSAHAQSPAQPPPFPENLTYHVTNLDTEAGEEAALEDLKACVNFIAGAVSGGGTVLVHCTKGSGRSAATVMAYLVHSQRVRADAAFRAVKAVRMVASPSMALQRLVAAYAQAELADDTKGSDK